MAADNFKIALDRVLQAEGGKVDDPRDPGGRTNQGVTQHVYDQFRYNVGQPLKDVFNIDPSERDAIYRRYWDAVGGDKLPHGLDLEAFDAAVNMGRPGESIGATARGFLAQATAPTTEGQIEQFRAARQEFYQGIKGPSGFQRYGQGWTSRNVETAAKATALSRAWEEPYPPPQATPSPVMPARHASAYEAIRTAIDMRLKGHSNSSTHHHRRG